MSSKWIFTLVALIGATGHGVASEGDPLSPKPNVLLICVDDLRTELGCYGNKLVQSPNIDQLASEGRLFSRHYVAQAACGPSRACLLTGRFHQSWAAWKGDWWKTLLPEQPISLPHMFKMNGYRTVGLGKISHSPEGPVDVPNSWDRAYKSTGPWAKGYDALFAFSKGRSYNAVAKVDIGGPHLPYEMPDVADNELPDGMNAEEAVRQLQDLKKRDQPFFLAVGFYKPHLPFVAPKKYWDLYKREEVGLARHRKHSQNIDPAIGHTRSAELSHYKWPPGLGNVPDEMAITLRHAYYACTSYTDAQIGRVLDELKRLELDKNTIVVLWSDHGYHLGEHDIFCKSTPYEIAVRSPLIIEAPGMKAHGIATPGIVETADLYPTLAELCDLTPPDDLQGQSVAATVRDPSAPTKGYARSIEWQPSGTCRTLRTDRWRFKIWTDKSLSKTLQIELYDHSNDPHELINVSAAHPEVVRELSAAIEERFPKHMP